jgi:hypothetical protein
MRGRLSKQKMKKFTEVLRLTGNVSGAARAVGIGRGTAYRWKKDLAEFAVIWDEAIDEAVDNLEAEAWRRATEGVAKPVYQQGQLVGHIQQYSDTLLIFLLKGHKPERYKDRAQVEHRAKVNIDDAKDRLRELLGRAKPALPTNGTTAEVY